MGQSTKQHAHLRLLLETDSQAIVHTDNHRVRPLGDQAVHGFFTVMISKNPA